MQAFRLFWCILGLTLANVLAMAELYELPQNSLQHLVRWALEKWYLLVSFSVQPTSY